jgi:hypothetical protein
MWYVWETGEVRADFWCSDLRERAYLEHLGVVGRILLKWIFKGMGKYGLG